MLREQWKVTFPGRDINPHEIKKINITMDTIYFCHLSTLMRSFHHGTSIVSEIDLEGHYRDVITFSDVHIHAFLFLSGYLVLVISEKQKGPQNILCCYNLDGFEIWRNEITDKNIDDFNIESLQEDIFIVSYINENMLELKLFSLAGKMFWERRIVSSSMPTFFTWDKEYFGFFTFTVAYKFNFLGEMFRLPVYYENCRYKIRYYDSENFYLTTNNRPQKIIKMDKNGITIWIHDFQDEKKFASLFYSKGGYLIVLGSGMYILDDITGGCIRTKNIGHVNFILNRGEVIYMFLFDKICKYNINNDDFLCLNLSEIIEYAVIRDNVLFVLTAFETNEIMEEWFRIRNYSIKKYEI